MANELSLSGSLAYEDSENSADSLAIDDLVASVVTKRFAHMKQNVAITEEALNLGDITSLGYCIMVNRDETNFVELKTATSGTLIIKLKAGEFAIFRFGTGVTAPFIIADTATCQVEYLLCSA